jgi:hypothetical protein
VNDAASGHRYGVDIDTASDIDTANGHRHGVGHRHRHVVGHRYGIAHVEAGLQTRLLVHGLISASFCTFLHI